MRPAAAAAAAAEARAAEAAARLHVEARPGDIVQIPADVKHWHGAAAGSAMAHFAIAEAVDGSAVTWMEKVAPEDYAAGPAQ